MVKTVARPKLAAAAANGSWPEARLGDHVDLLSGFPFKSVQFTDSAEDIPLVKGENVQQGFIDWNKAKRWKADEFESFAKFALLPGDVVLAMDRPWIDAGLKFAWIRRHDPPSLLVQRVSRLRGINGLCSGFVRFLIGSPAFTNYIKPIVTGINVPHISGEQIRRFQFRLPPIATQQKIVGVLGAYDELIENNRRRIEILEEMARRLYREWFVQFRFPGHAHVPLTDSPLGKIPKGWEVVKLGDIATKIGSGATPRGGQSAYHDHGITLIRSLNVYDDRFEDDGLAFIDDDQAADLSNVVVERRDILLNITGASVCRCCMVPERHLPARVNQHVTIIRVDPNRSDPFFVLSSINSFDRKQQLLAYAQGGATREALTKEKVSNFQIVMPSEKLLRQFAAIATDLHHQCEVLANKIANLQTTRDLLLPRLISGELDVSELPIAVEEAARDGE